MDTYRKFINGRYALTSIGISLILSAIMVPLFKLGISPLPKPTALAFAETLLGHALPLPVGLLFHVAYVSLWSYIYFLFIAKPSTLFRASALAFILWLATLFVFFPFIGWGVAGLQATPKAPIASLVPHVLLALFLWLFGRKMNGKRVEKVASV